MPNNKGTRKNRGEGSIRFLNHRDLYEARVTVGYKEGKRVQKSIYGATEEEVVQKKNKLLAQYGLGVAIPDKATVTQMLLDWLEYKKTTVKPTTYGTYERMIENHITPQLGRVLVQKLEVDHLDNLYREMHRKGLRRGTIRVAHNIMHDSLERLRRRKKISENVADLVDELPKDKEAFEATAWSVDDARKFLQAVQHDRLFALYWLALTGSFRRGELLGLKWSAIRLESHPIRGQYVVINVLNNRTQNGKEVVELAPKTHRSKRPVILPYQAWEVLQAHKAQMETYRQELAKKGYSPADEGYVFLSTYLEPIHPSNFYNRVWLPLLDEVGVPSIRFHDLRHTNITLDLATGGDLKTASQRAGHSSINITANVYQHPDLEQHLDSTTRIAQLLTFENRSTDSRPN
jgi:integrase